MEKGWEERLKVEVMGSGREKEENEQLRSPLSLHIVDENDMRLV